MKVSVAHHLGLIGVLCLALTLLDRLEPALMRSVHGSSKEIQWQTLDRRFASAMAATVLGGLRSFAADLIWIQAYVKWEQRDAEGCESLMRLAISVCPENEFFWVGTARTLAYDLSRWEGVETGPGGMAAREDGGDSGTAGRSAGGDAAARALNLLDEALDLFPGRTNLVIEQALIQLNVQHDVEAAADSFRQAAELPGAPYYVARVYGELLRAIGRHEEALQWYEELLLELPDDDPLAFKEIVRARAIELREGLQRGFPVSE